MMTVPLSLIAEYFVGEKTLHITLIHNFNITTKVVKTMGKQFKFYTL